MASEWAREMKHGKNGCWMCNFWWVREIFNVTIFHYFLHVHLTSACSNFHIFRKVSWVTSSLRFFLLFFFVEINFRRSKKKLARIKKRSQREENEIHSVMYHISSFLYIFDSYNQQNSFLPLFFRASFSLMLFFFGFKVYKCCWCCILKSDIHTQKKRVP